VLHADLLAADTASAGRFLREARAAARIKHPGIVDVVDFGHLGDGRPYFVMELLSGQTLADALDDGALAPPRAVILAKQLAAALTAAHGGGVIHRDLTPSNVFLESSGGEERMKLVDFGVAHLRGTSDDDDVPKEYVFGTPAYISPEQLRGLPTDERCDIYSLGIILFEMLNGGPPFRAETVKELVRHHLYTPPPTPTAAEGVLPQELVQLVMRCLNKDPAARYQSAADLLDDLERIERTFSRKGWRRWLPT